VLCCSDLDLIRAAKFSAGCQQLSRSLPWHRLFLQQPRSTFSTCRADTDVGLRVETISIKLSFQMGETREFLAQIDDAILFFEKPPSIRSAVKSSS
jgi:hypothetical protein